MRIYKDIFTGASSVYISTADCEICADDEMTADTYPMKIADDVILECTGKYEVRKQGEIVLAGANASAEGDDEDDGTDEAVGDNFLPSFMLAHVQVERGIDIVLNHRLQDMTSVFGDTKQFKEFIKDYMKKCVMPSLSLS